MPNKTVVQANLHSDEYPYSAHVMVADESEAVQAAVTNLSYCFNVVTFDVTYDVVPSPQGDVEKMSRLKILEETPTRWFGHDKTLTTQDVIDSLDAVIQNFDAAKKQGLEIELSTLTLRRQIYSDFAEAFKKFGYEQSYIQDPRPYMRSYDPYKYRPLAEGEKVFNKTGQKIWPNP